MAHKSIARLLALWPTVSLRIEEEVVNEIEKANKVVTVTGSDIMGHVRSAVVDGHRSNARSVVFILCNKRECLKEYKRAANF